MTGVEPAKHGIAANHYLRPDGVEAQLTDPAALRAETILAAAARAGVGVLAVTAKDKLRGLLGAGDVPSMSAERAHEQTLDGLAGATGVEVAGEPNPEIYDPALSIYAIDLALALADRLSASLVYCSLTDYVQHKAAPGDALANALFAGLDERVGRALDQGWVVGMVADHGMNAKTRADGRPNVRYLDDALSDAGIEARVILPIADPYVVHHGALGSIAFVYVKPEGLGRSRVLLTGLPGVEAVLDRSASARRFGLPGDRIGDLIVLADASTVLGTSRAQHDLSGLGNDLRSHGGLHEREVPLLVWHRLAAGVPIHDLRNADLFALLLNHVA